MKIKAGEYVKLKRGDIFKIDENTTNYYNSNEEFITNEIVKHSKNIIDIIEIGDYVNGCRVINFVFNNEKKVGVAVDSEVWAFDTWEIRTIVTKEQMREMEYVV